MTTAQRDEHWGAHVDHGMAHPKRKVTDEVPTNVDELAERLLPCPTDEEK